MQSFFGIFAPMMKKRCYIFSLLLAMLIVLSSNMLAHHHHLNEICFDVEICSIDGNINDNHTSDPCQSNSSDDTCEIEQMHTFLTSVKSVLQLQQTIFSQPFIFYAVVPRLLFPLYYLEQQQTAFSEIIIKIPERFVSSGGLRAPPVLVA